MKSLTELVLLLRDFEDDIEFNKRIMDYINDRYTYIIDSGYYFTIEILDDTNINEFIKKGINSIPALIHNNDIDYGVNNIIVSLAKLETLKNLAVSSEKYDETDRINDFYKTAMEEMLGDEQESENAPSTIKMKNQDYSESPIDDKEINSKFSKMDSYYQQRFKKDKKGGQIRSKLDNKEEIVKPKLTTAQQEIENLISSKGYDKAEADFWRQNASNI